MININDVEKVENILASISTAEAVERTGIDRVKLWKIKNGKVKVENLTLSTAVKLFQLI